MFDIRDGQMGCVTLSREDALHIINDVYMLKLTYFVFSY